MQPRGRTGRSIDEHCNVSYFVGGVAPKLYTEPV